MHFDAIIVGGSFAGLSAALQLGRARRTVLVIDAGERRNRFASASHGFLGRDGVAPDEIIAEATSQLSRYVTVATLKGYASKAGRTEQGFYVETHNDTFHGERLIIAGGVADILPDIPGLADGWGTSIFHCPYCHGYELERGPIGVLATSTLSMHHAMMLPDWGPTTLLINDSFIPDETQRSALAGRGVSVEEGRVRRIFGQRPTVELANGRTIDFAGIFTLGRTMPGPIAEQLGCDLKDGPLGKFIGVDEQQQTSVPQVFACGDVARAAGSIALAVSDGSMAGVAAHRSLIF
ncbi:NAD(P)/FAD-dependent oxidoreductase [Bradyrhizobium sp. 190]|uniref:NAD(P)/FAD-dependent oxidoreductase n=1 Tax=Bradyrhizobium sp. 190 TaxID=2782658 RepID=UPI001FFB1895|nr:NAD(P)/FAD-dependent oxidoreductase [Bradyrhizobium sp. 190]MCK1511491.1 NAD(P)/FAD-dependent oxidoreductase [Bradyrhizobium sp. 190]